MNIESKSILYSEYVRLLEYAKDNRLTSYCRDAFPNMQNEEHTISLVADVTIYILLYYGIHSINYRPLFEDIIPEINDVLIGDYAIDCSKIAVSDVLELYDSVFRHIPFNGYDELTEEMDFNNLRKFLMSLLGTGNIYEPNAALSSFCLSYSWKYVTDRMSYIILSVYSVLGRETIRQRQIQFEQKPVSQERTVVYGQPGQTAFQDKKFSGIILCNNETADVLEQEIYNSIELLTANGIIAILDFTHTLSPFGSSRYNGNDSMYPMRKYLIDNNLLDAIHYGYIENGDDDTSIYILKKDRDSDKISIIDDNNNYNIYQDCKRMNIVSTSIIRRLNYSFNATDLSGIPDNLSASELPYLIRDILKPYYEKSHSDSIGKVFSLKDFDKVHNRDYISFTIDVNSLQEKHIDNSFKKVTDPVLVISPFLGKLQMAYIIATEKAPVYIPAYFYVRTVNTTVVTHKYIYYLQQIGKLQQIFKPADNTYRPSSESDLFYHLTEQIAIPISKDDQEKQMRDAELIWKVEADKEAAWDKLFKQQEWLNEKHIRNIKHRLNDELTPLIMGLDRLQDKMDEHNGILNYSDIVARHSGQTTKDLISILRSISHQIKESIRDLTDSNDFGKEDMYDVSELIKNYTDSHITQKYSICSENRCSGKPVIKMSEKSFRELLDYIVSNACRHGFVDPDRKDYNIRITVAETYDRKCRILIDNNGVKMPPRAEDIYFVHGEYAGKTGHSGIGGARVREITEHFGGTARLLNDNSDYPVKIELTFPIIEI